MMRTIDELKIARDEAIAQDTRWALSASECFALHVNSSSLSNADLSNADLSNADLSGANLRGADLYYANLRGADLYYADLSNANLSGADLSNANLSGANLSGATLYYANGIVRFGPLGSRSNDLYIVKHDASLMVKAGCFWGMETDFLAAVAKTHGDNRHAKAYRAALVLAHMVLDAAETAEGGRMMSVDEKAREMARQYIPHEGGFSMGGLLQNIIEYFEADVAQLRADRNAAQQRAEQAERERDEARDTIDRAIEILNTPPSGIAREKEIAGEHATVNAMLTRYRAGYAPQAQPAPTVKADDDRYPILNRMTITPKADTPIGGLSLQQIVERASNYWEKAGNMEIRASDRGYWMHAAVGDILDIVERLVKGGAS